MDNLGFNHLLVRYHQIFL